MGRRREKETKARREGFRACWPEDRSARSPRGSAPDCPGRQENGGGGSIALRALGAQWLKIIFMMWQRCAIGLLGGVLEGWCLRMADYVRGPAAPPLGARRRGVLMLPTLP